MKESEHICPSYKARHAGGVENFVSSYTPFNSLYTYGGSPINETECSFFDNLTFFLNITVSSGSYICLCSMAG